MNKEKQNWEEKFDEIFPYKIQGAPKHTKLLFINREIKSFIKNILLEHDRELKVEILTWVQNQELHRVKYFDTSYEVENANGFNDAINLVAEHIQSLLALDEESK